MAMYPVKNGKDAQKAAAEMAKLFGPSQVDQTIRQAIQFCWMSLPAKRRNVKELEKQVRRIFERAMRNLREDGEAFGRSE
jgi:hypothetical protein